MRRDLRKLEEDEGGVRAAEGSRGQQRAAEGNYRKCNKTVQGLDLSPIQGKHKEELNTIHPPFCTTYPFRPSSL